MAVKDFSQEEMDALRARVASGKALQSDALTLLLMVDRLKFEIFKRQVVDFEAGKTTDPMLVPVGRVLILSSWMSRQQRARVLWLRYQALRDERDAMWKDECPEGMDRGMFERRQAARSSALRIQLDAVCVRLARVCERLTDAEIADLIEESDRVCGMEAV